ncbi:hypothetical protein [uncultured Vibrio sp.]|uniref:hypothetical protein n=1 Tax=uncultured Vibrio sp. TaxID=114054 RepID=UPI0029C6F1CB|nr:hypothetical protein [uncultured Vibrio sp.]
MEMIQTSPKTQRVAAMAVILAVLFQLYLASTAVLNPTQVHNKNWLSEFQNEKVLLCTADGFKWVSINSLIAANSDSASPFIHNLNLHEGFQFECPLLQAVQLFVLCAIGLCLATIDWLRRVKPLLSPYRLAQCGRLVYKHIAPKQSPPCIFPA